MSIVVVTDPPTDTSGVTVPPDGTAAAGEQPAMRRSTRPGR
jgi:hypothetical protein